MNQKAAKEIIRKNVLRKLRNLTKEERRQKSLEIKEKLFRSRVFKNATTIMFFVSKEDEVDTFMMIRQALRMGKKVAVPVIQHNKKSLLVSEIRDMKRELVRGPYTIYQPAKEFIKPMKPDELDLVLIPGIAFTKAGLRLGRGKGYFDRFLKKLPQSIERIGVSFNFQILKTLPISPHDMPVSRVLTA
ncbi:MAG: 5-formyltetrahydrofolate cyclo-ligase [Candidatus Omnitrophota bacterium]